MAKALLGHVGGPNQLHGRRSCIVFTSGYATWKPSWPG